MVTCPPPDGRDAVAAAAIRSGLPYSPLYAASSAASMLLSFGMMAGIDNTLTIF
jgi:hypothetical protein